MIGRIHDLRDTFGTQAIASGANVHDLQTWMGHRHLATTMRHGHYRPQRENADPLGRRFAGTVAQLDELLGDSAGDDLAAARPTIGDELASLGTTS